ncbi:hypothetical protein QBC46DRAFT_375960 [Diplogelasinospora grovesii]|uniref:UBX domain-containing protein n=1 Tax=Diplogelasinospora grovesii TaxID=303347 RepID=A0AAN6NEH3_9PEZI|nr:hypothetical protein QBC46DRAFT_375960 [Diplogelasinospora grovesii]
MSDEGEFDLGQLSDTQQEALLQYTDVTGQGIKDAIPLLRRSEWNVQIAIAKFFDGEGPDLVAQARAAQNDAPPRPTATHENLYESLSASSLNPPDAWLAHRTDPAPRVVPPRTRLFRPPWILALLLMPFHLGYRTALGMLRFVLYLLSFLPHRTRPRAVTPPVRKGLRRPSERAGTESPKDTAERFRRELEEEYGPTELPFFEGGHAQALDAAKKDLKFLLTVLISPEHDNTDSFIRHTLLSPAVVNLIRDPANNMILWAGNVLDAEAYNVASQYGCVGYPFSCLACLTPKEGSTRIGIIARMVGPTPATTYVDAMQRAIAKWRPDLDSLLAERAAQAMARNLRSEQDSAYERSLARDREKARQRREAAAAAAAAEQRAREEAEAAERLQKQRQQWRKWRATTIPPEPHPQEKDAVRLALNLPASSDVGRLVRRFPGQSTLEDVYAFVECHELLSQQQQHSAGGDEKVAEPEDYVHQYAFTISSVMPRETLEPSKTTTIAEKMGRGGSLVVEDSLATDAGLE